MHYGIKEGEGLSEQIFDEIVEKVLKKRAKKRAMSLLQKKDYTEDKLRFKLKEGYYFDEIIDETIDYLKEYGYINDIRYAEHFMELHGDEITLSDARLKLYKMGIRSETIDEVLANFEFSDEKNLILKIFEKRNFNPSQANEKETNKMIRYLISKGFSQKNIRDMLK
ncbi:MAG: RecX family transcriptional regulator [Eubacterium sp.]|nr:RecX family transcriptional regulator [Eubacterium sp.]